MIEFLSNIDNQLMDMLNGANTPYITAFMQLYTGKVIWAALYATIAIVLFVNLKPKTALMAFLAIVLVIVFADQVVASVIRPIVERPRPNNPLSPMYEFVFKTRDSGGYGFPSCHGANTFGLAFIVAYVFKNRWLTTFFLLWATLNSYTRIYLGLHFPGDILAGAFIGWVGAFIMYRLLLWVSKGYFKEPIQYKWINLPIWTGLATIAAICITALIQTL